MVPRREPIVAQARTSPDRIAGIGIANQRETAVFWDRETGAPQLPGHWGDKSEVDKYVF